jgi:hypothetical protein
MGICRTYLGAFKPASETRVTKGRVLTVRQQQMQNNSLHLKKQYCWVYACIHNFRPKIKLISKATPTTATLLTHHCNTAWLRVHSVCSDAHYGENLKNNQQERFFLQIALNPTARAFRLGGFATERTSRRPFLYPHSANPRWIFWTAAENLLQLRADRFSTVRLSKGSTVG